MLALAACQDGEGQLSIRDAWARQASAGLNSAVYFQVDNLSNRSVSLVAASGDVANAVEIHESVMDESGTMRMQPQSSVVIPAGGQVSFEPGGLHVMLVGVNQDLNRGDTFSLVLDFGSDGERTVEVIVRAP
jgi:copper(I)-binding protein